MRVSIPARVLWVLSGAWLVVRLHRWLWRRRWASIHLWLAGLVGAALSWWGMSAAHAPDCHPAPVELLGAAYPLRLTTEERP